MHCDHCSRKVEPFLDISLSLDLLHTAKTNLSPTKNHSLNGDGEICEVDLTQDEINLDPGVPSNDVTFTSLNSQPESLKEVKVKLDPHDESITLYQCLQHYTSIETLSEQVQCDACKQHRPSRKRLTLAATPKVLILHFKRFDSLRQLKICSKVNFPLKGLDLAPFMQQQQQQPSQRKQNADDRTPSSQILGSGDTQYIPPITKAVDSKSTPLLYDLQGLISHKGSLHQVSYDMTTAHSYQFYI